MPHPTARPSDHDVPPMRMPAEWQTHRTLWTAWPYDQTAWGPPLGEAQHAVVALCRALQQGGAEATLLVPGAAEEAHAREALKHAGTEARIERIPYGDIWLRDTGPLFVRSDGDDLAAVVFRFNAWGGKYPFPHDPSVGGAIARAVGVPVVRSDLVAEGGAIDVDGTGVGLTTRQCLQNSNRNPHWSEREIETELRRCLGIERLLWLDRGLLHDHTDGHIDNIARFVAPNLALVMEARTANDPQRDVLIQARRTLQAANIAVEVLPSPGLVLDVVTGAPAPASYLNFVIANGVVILPTYGTPHDETAQRGLEALFPARQVLGIDARALLSGGGAFHCVTQQEPLPCA